MNKTDIRRLVPPVPASWTAWTRMGRRVWSVVSIPRYSLLTVSLSIVSLFLHVLASNFIAVRDIVLSGSLSIELRLQVLLYLFPLVGGVNPGSDVGNLLVAILAGVVGSVAVFQLVRGVAVGKGAGSAGVSIVGSVVGGCGACGTVLLAATVGSGAAGLLTVLPFNGVEVPWIAAGFLVLSIFWITEQFGVQCQLPEE